MEGAYNKLRNARAQVPSPDYIYFMDVLMETVRKEFAVCAAKAYGTLRVSEATKLLLLHNDAETLEFAKQRNWKVVNNVIDFASSQGKQNIDELDQSRTFLLRL